MAKSKQNQVPQVFRSLYNPLLELKRFLQGEIKLGNKQLIDNLQILYYTTFVFAYLKDTDNSKLYQQVRGIIENMFTKESAEVTLGQIGQLCSLIDKFAKKLNLTERAYIFISLYSGYLDEEIYRRIHCQLTMFQTVSTRVMKPESVQLLKDYYIASVEHLRAVH